jgi:hypothetical protein
LNRFRSFASEADVTMAIVGSIKPGANFALAAIRLVWRESYSAEA